MEARRPRRGDELLACPVEEFERRGRRGARLDPHSVPVRLPSGTIDIATGIADEVAITGSVAPLTVGMPLLAGVALVPAIPLVPAVLLEPAVAELPAGMPPIALAVPADAGGVVWVRLIRTTRPTMAAAPSAINTPAVRCWRQSALATWPSPASGEGPGPRGPVLSLALDIRHTSFCIGLCGFSVGIGNGLGQ